MVKIFLKDLESSSSSAIEIQPPVEFLQDFGDDYIYYRIYWITNEKLGKSKTFCFAEIHIEN